MASVEGALRKARELKRELEELGVELSDELRPPQPVPPRYGKDSCLEPPFVLDALDRLIAELARHRPHASDAGRHGNGA